MKYQSRIQKKVCSRDIEMENNIFREIIFVVWGLAFLFGCF